MKHVSILVPQGDISMIDIIGCYRGFNRANQYLASQGRKPAFTVQLVGASTTHRPQEELFSVRAQVNLYELKRTDLVIIPAIGWDFEKGLVANKDLMEWILEQRRKGAELASMCVGGFLLASTGLLDGQSCSTHWAAADAFRRLFPEVNLVCEKILTDERGIYTNGGALSFVNLLLYLIEKHAGRETAIFCAKVFEADIDRSSQSAFTMFTGLKDHHDREIKKAQQFLEEHIGEKINFERLASELGLGRRTFDRRFIKATYNTPVEYLQRVKMEAAKKTLETSRKTISEVMYAVGYSDMKAFRDVFRKITGLSPLDYRNKYNKEAFLT